MLSLVQGITESRELLFYPAVVSSFLFLMMQGLVQCRNLSIKFLLFTQESCLYYRDLSRVGTRLTTQKSFLVFCFDDLGSGSIQASVYQSSSVYL